MGPPMVLIVTLGKQYNVGERLAIIQYTNNTLIALPGHQTQQKQKTIHTTVYLIKKVVVIINDNNAI